MIHKILKKLALANSFLLIFASVSSAANVCQKTNAVACWEFVEGSGSTTYDQSFNRFVGTFNGTAAWSTTIPSGYAGFSIDFDGVNTNQGRIYGPDNSTLEIQNPLSVVSWIKPTNYSSSRPIWGGDDGVSYFFFYVNTSGKTVAGKRNAVDFGAGTTAVTTGAWNHVAATIDSSGNYTYYLDGVSNGTGTNSQTYTYRANVDAVIGATWNPSTGNNNLSFLGQIGQTGLFDEELTSVQINAIMDNGFSDEPRRLWSSGFELQSVTSGVEWDGIVIVGASIDTSIKRSGAASLKMVGSSTLPLYAQQTVRSASSAPIYLKFGFYVGTFDSTYQVAIGRIMGSDVEKLGVYLNTNGTLTLKDGSGGHSSTGSSVLTTGQWYVVEIGYDGINGTGELRLNGTTEASITAATGTSDQVELADGDVYIKTGTYYYDDVAVNEGRGTNTEPWAGLGKIVHLHPNAAGDFDEGSEHPTTGNPYASLDEVTPDDTSTDYELEIDGERLDLNIEAGSTIGMDEGAGDTITLVSVGGRLKGDTTSPSSLKLRLKSQSSGTIFKSPLVEMTTNSYFTNKQGGPTNYLITSYYEPQAGGAWTTSLIDSTQIGYEAVDAAPNVFASTLWLLVEYAEPVVTTTTFTPKFMVY